jgi:hypothetical protein
MTILSHLLMFVSLALVIVADPTTKWRDISVCDINTKWCGISVSLLLRIIACAVLFLALHLYFFHVQPSYMLYPG